MRHSAIIILVIISFSIKAQIVLTPYTSGITKLVDIASCGDDRIFLVQRHGIILIGDSSGNINPVPFLSIAHRVNGTALEPGLLGMAFAPDFVQSGIFYVYFTEAGTNINRISRFHISSNPDVADSLDEDLIINISTTTTHLGGDMAFGSDGYLYISLGDGGGEGDPQNHAQDPALLLGKFLRLDVSDTSQAGYAIPPSNPFLNGPYLPEVWSIGWRNPWRWSFDRLTNEMWIGDVGQLQREEIDFENPGIHGGLNYGWRCYEASLPYNSGNCIDSVNYTYPIYEYSHGTGCSVTGGFVYRGALYNTMFGKYFYSDWYNQAIRSLTKQGSVVTPVNHGALGLSSGVICFGEDKWGELLVGAYNGTVYRLQDTSAHHIAWISDEDTLKVCTQSMTILQTPAGPGFHYEWYNDSVSFATDTNAVMVAADGNYFVVVTNGSGQMQTSDPVYVEFIQGPSASITGLDSTYCNTTTVSVNYNVAPAGGIIRLDNQIQATTNINPSTLSLGHHTLTYSYSDSNGCTAFDSFNFTVNVCTEIEENNTGRLLYPNPAETIIYVPSEGLYTIYETNGKLIEQIVVKDKSSREITIAHLSKGMYILTLENQKERSIFRFVK